MHLTLFPISFSSIRSNRLHAGLGHWAWIMWPPPRAALCSASSVGYTDRNRKYGHVVRGMTASPICPGHWGEQDRSCVASGTVDDSCGNHFPVIEGCAELWLR